VAEGGGLLNRYTLKRRIVGSNPILSAIFSLSHSPLIAALNNNRTRLGVPAKILNLCK
jgi:hypothetical protein